MDRGFLLIELVLSLCVLALAQFALLSLIGNITKIEFKAKIESTYFNLREVQFYSLATDRDADIIVDNNSLLMSIENIYSKQLSFSNLNTVVINRSSGLGLKSNLNTKYAGTIKFYFNDISKKITFPVGLTLLTLK
tara:strand:- start:1558 stop:1965 length:408 start_codon:yes stop_codon:yes gene_type:complete